MPRGRRPVLPRSSYVYTVTSLLSGPGARCLPSCSYDTATPSPSSDATPLRAPPSDAHQPARKLVSFHCAAAVHASGARPGGRARFLPRAFFLGSSCVYSRYVHIAAPPRPPRPRRRVACPVLREYFFSSLRAMTRGGLCSKFASLSPRTLFGFRGSGVLWQCASSCPRRCAPKKKLLKVGQGRREFLTVPRVCRTLSLGVPARARRRTPPLARCRRSRAAAASSSRLLAPPG